MKFGVYTLYSPMAGSARVRVYDWLRYLNLEATHHQYIGEATAGAGQLVRHPLRTAAAEASLRRFDGSDEDTVLVSREVSPLSRGELEERVLRSARWGVYDFDDALYHYSSFKRRVFGGSKKFERTVAAADIVIAGNEYLAEWARRRNSNVVVIPSCVDVRDYKLASRTAGGPPVMAWIGSASTERYLEPLIDQLLTVNRETGARLRIIGSVRDNPNLARLRHMTDRVRWTINNFARDLATSDLGLGPLVDTAFARGKCSYKLIQYGAAGLPMVGSSVGANAAVLQRLGGVSVGEAEEWITPILGLLDESEAASADRGAFSRARVEEFYSFQNNAALWQKAVLSRPV